MDKEISDETLATVFSRLKLYSIDLLELLRNPKKDASFLPEMAEFLRGAPSDALQPYLDFTLFPLLLLLDAAVKCRSEKKVDLCDPFGGLVIGDYVAENMLMCLEEVLKKCYLGSVNQMVVVLKKLTSGALLLPSKAAEEFRGGIIRCLREMFLRIQPCPISSCSCKQTSQLLTVILKHLEPPCILKHLTGTECLVAFLQSQDASAAVGHLLSLLLQTAEVEAARGHLGSGRLRKEAFLTLRVLVAKVGSADALAYFLPGIVSRFSKALHVAKNMISGAAGNTGGIEQAVRGLTEFLMIVLSDDTNCHDLEAPYDVVSGCSQNDNKTTEAVLDALRHLPARSQAKLENVAGSSLCQSMMVYPSNNVFQDKAGEDGTKFLYVHRTKQWIDDTSTNVDRMLSAIFPHLCTHPSEKVRKGLVDGVRGLLFNCSYTLRRSKLMLLECLCVLISDDSDVVSVTALESLESLFMLEKKFLSENEISEIFTRLVEKLPIVVFGCDETVAVSHARRLLALIYFAGPELVVDQLLCSPVKAARFFECFELALSHNSRYAGNVNNLVLSKPLSVGYLLSISELKSGSAFNYSSDSFAGGVPSIVSKIVALEDKSMENSVGSAHGDSEFSHMPPWFIHIGSQKLYQAIAGILRLVGLSIVADQRSEVSLSSIIDIPLQCIHKLILEIRMKNYNKVGWQMWCSQSVSGQLLRQCSTAVCILNEMIYGLSDQSVGLYMKIFRKAGRKAEGAETKEFIFNQADRLQYNILIWKLRQGVDTRSHIIHCIGSILRVYLSPEVWDLPINQNSPLLEHDVEANVPLHFFHDVTMLHQEIYCDHSYPVIIEGIGIFSITLGKDFLSSGFMHSSLFLLLQNLISLNYQIRTASDAVLQLLSVATGYSSVGHLVVANADYVIDALCRQLRHLDLNPNIPHVLAAMLSYVGAAHDILPLLEEPMQAVCLELEVLGRHQHPNLTLPFLQAMGEICKASRCEASKLTKEAESFSERICFKVSCLQNRGKANDSQNSCPSTERNCMDVSDVGLQLEHWEELLFKLNEMKRYRRTVGSLVGSCLNAATPLLGSLKESPCLEALNIIEDATISLAEVERAYKVEKETKVAIEEAIQLCLRNGLQDNMDAADEDAEENRLLPAMNRIWPYLILCLKNKVSVAVMRRCTIVISKVIQISGGDFFVRRFHTDGPVIWKILASSPLQRRPLPSKNEKLILLPYRSTSLSSGDEMAETSSLKVQAAVLNMIGEIASNTKSASAMQVVLKKVSGLVVGIACSSVTGLRDASFRALAGLASIDPDLIWLLLADVYYAMKNRSNTVSAPGGLASISEILPAPSSSKDYLYVQYGGEDFGFDLNPVSVETVFQKMQTEVLTM